MKRQYKIINLCTFLMLFILWIATLYAKGMTKVIAWSSLTMLFPIISGIWMIGAVIGTVRCIRKKAGLVQPILMLCISGIMAFPILFMMDIIPMAYPNSIDEAQPAIIVEFPLKEKTVVGWGGDKIEDNKPHAKLASERWAYDLVMEPYNHGSSYNEEYGIWGQEVVAPATGRVIAAFDEEEDILPLSEEFLSGVGNHVYIELEDTKTYLILAHLQKDSVTVKKGDYVSPGDVIGRVGNSGTTSEPHLHIQHQRQNPLKSKLGFLAEGLPLYFQIDDKVEMPRAHESIVP